MLRWIDEGHWSLGALSAADQDRLNKALALFPSCYSDDFANCTSANAAERAASKYPHCAELNQLWGDNKSDPVYKELHDRVEKMPYCPERAAAPSGTSPWLVVAGAAIVALGIGLVLGRG